METYNTLKERFTEHSDDARALQMAAYMRHRFAFYGLPASLRRAQYNDILQARKKQNRVDWELLDRCWADPHREMQYFVFDCLAAMQKHLSFDDISRIRPYLSTKQWWDTIDALSKVVGRISDDRVGHLMLEWSKDPDFWLRRVAILHQLDKKDHMDRELLERILLNNLGSDEFFINKAIGWILREYSKTSPSWVRRFVEINQDRLSKLSIREGSKYIEASFGQSIESGIIQKFAE